MKHTTQPSSRSKLRILAVAPQPFYTPRGTPLSVYYRTLVMCEAGASIDLLTYGVGEDVDIPGMRTIRIPRFGLKRVKIGPSLTKAALDVWMLLYTIALLLRRRYDVVHAHEESVFWCRFLKPIFGFRLIYDMHSSLPQQLTNFSFTTSRLLIGAFDQLERTCLKHADAVITICPDLKEYALSHGVDAERHFLIENSIFEDVQLKSRISTDNGVRKSGSPSPAAPRASSIVYAGTFELYQGIDLLLRAFVHVLDDQPETELLLVGGSPVQVGQMQELASKLGIARRCTFTGQLPKSQAIEHCRSASVLVSPRVRGTNTPLKVYEQLASGVPLVATRIWSHTQVLNDDACELVDPEPSAMAKGLLVALTDQKRRTRMVRAAMALYERSYSRQVYEEKIDALLRRVAAYPKDSPRGASSREQAMVTQKATAEV